MQSDDHQRGAERVTVRLDGQRRAHRDRGFRPHLSDTLEKRELLSAVVTGGRVHSPLSTNVPAHIDSGSKLEFSLAVEQSAYTVEQNRQSQYSRAEPESGGTEMQNVPFPTVGGQSERLDVYLPTTPVPSGGRPVMVAIHGGGWRRFDKTGYGEHIASEFTKSGYVVVAPDYELSQRDLPSWPVNFEDVQAAVSWVRGQASTLDINPNAIAAIGESAGANLAALLGTSSPRSSARTNSAAVDAVVAFSPPTDLTSLYTESPSAGLAAAQFLGGSPEQVPANYVAASPIDHVAADDPPMLLVHGLQDTLIPVSQSEQMARALTAAGVRNRLILVHGGHNLDFPIRYSNLIPQILEFLQTTWKD